MPANQPLANDLLNQLETALSARFHKYSVSLDVATTSESSADWSGNSNSTVTYHRPFEEAQNVEYLLGCDMPLSELNLRRHPVIELRLTPNHFSVELVVSPEAWLDQQNLIGKLGIQRHREAFRSTLQRMDGDFRLGFWSGCELSDMHLTTRQLSRGNNLQEWMSTFCDGQDWLRVGVWYTPEAPQLDTSRILRELTDRIGALYRVYTFLTWTSNNDFLSFYGKQVHRPAYARVS